MVEVLQGTQILTSEYVLPEAAGESSERAIGFREAMGEASRFAPHVIDFDRILDVASQDQSQTLSRSCLNLVLQAVETKGQGFFTDSRQVADRLRSVREIKISRTSIAESSVHRVFFASLVGHQQSRVAIKSFDPTKHGSTNGSVADWVNTLLARRLGLDTFAPVAFLVSGAIGYTITERQDDLDPMDNTDWTIALSDPPQVNMLNDIRRIGPSLAHLHHLGCYHGDPQLKNSVLTQRGSVHFIDWEGATIIEGQQFDEDKGRSELMQLTIRDLRVNFGSLARSTANHGVGLLDRQTPLTQYQNYDELILSPYIEERVRLLETEPPEVQDDMLAFLADVHEDLSTYIQTGEIYKTLSRKRNGHE